MRKPKLTKEQRQELFDNNFNKESYEQAKRIVQNAITSSSSFEMLWNNLREYERDVEYEGTSTIIYCEMELDKKPMQTQTDYVGIQFTILWDDNQSVGMIFGVELYTSDTPNHEIMPMCFFNPDTLEIVRWNHNFPY